MILLEVSVVWVGAHALLAGRVLHALAHQMVAHVADALQRVREVRADLENTRLVERSKGIMGKFATHPPLMKLVG